MEARTVLAVLGRPLRGGDRQRDGAALLRVRVRVKVRVGVSLTLILTLTLSLSLTLTTLTLNSRRIDFLSSWLSLVSISVGRPGTYLQP